MLPPTPSGGSALTTLPSGITRSIARVVPEVNQLLEARKLMERAMKQMGKGKMPSLAGLQATPGGAPTTRHPGSKRKKTKRKSRR